MKIYLAMRDDAVLAAFRQQSCAAKVGEEVLEFDLLEKIPKPTTIFMRRGVVEKPTHPTDWGRDVMTRPHFHAGPTEAQAKELCAGCNKGHSRSGHCGACQQMKVTQDQSGEVQLFPWDTGIPIPKGEVNVKVSRGRGPRVVSVVGRSKGAVDAAFRKAIETAKKELQNAA